MSIPATILPSQLFVIHNPLSDDSEDVDYDNFFSFIKRRTSEFKHRGRDVFSFIQQAQIHTTDKEEIKSLILTFTDARYSSSKIESANEDVIVKFKDFVKTYFDSRLNEIEDVKDKYNTIEQKGKRGIYSTLSSTKRTTKAIDIILTVIIILLISMVLRVLTN